MSDHEQHEHNASEIYVGPSKGYLPDVLIDLENRSRKANERNAPVLPALDEECACAYGRDDLSPDPDCGKCQGSGYQLTDAGRALLAFLQRHPPALTRTT